MNLDAIINRSLLDDEPPLHKKAFYILYVGQADWRSRFKRFRFIIIRERFGLYSNAYSLLRETSTNIFYYTFYNNPIEKFQLKNHYQETLIVNTRTTLPWLLKQQ